MGNVLWIRKIRHQLMLKPLYFRMLAYFLLTLVPLAVIGFLVYFANLSVHKSKLVETLDSQLGFSATSVDGYLRTTERVAINFFMNESVQQLLVPAGLKTEAEKARTTSITNVLASSRQILSPSIDDMFVYIDRELVYSSTGTEDYDLFFNRFNVFERYDESYWDELVHLRQSFRMLAPTRVDKQQSGRSYPVVPIISKQYVRGHQAVMVVTIPTRTILDTLRANALDASMRYIVADYEGNLIASDIEGEAQAILGMSWASSSVEVRLAGVDYLVSRLISDYGWSYYSLAPKRLYAEQAGGILQLISWFCVIFVAAGVALSFVFSKRLYSPIQTILDQERERETFSGVLLDNVFRHIVQGYKPAHYERIMQGIGFSMGQYMCICIRFDLKEAFDREVQDIEREVIFEKLKRVIGSVFAQRLTAHIVEAQPRFYVVMVNLRHEGERHTLDDCLDSLRETFAYDLRYYRLAIGVGKLYPSVEGLSESLDDARMALARAVADEDLVVVTAADMPASEAYSLSYLEEYKLLNALKTNGTETILGLVEEIVERNMDEGISGTSMQLLLLELYNTGLKFARDRQLPLRQLVSEEEHRILSGESQRLMDVQAHVRRLVAFLIEAARSAAVPDSSRASQLAQQAIEYIEQHYTEELYLDKLAEQLGLSAKYFSRMFKDETGRSPSDYISMRRIAEAKRLLATTRLRNEEIAERVGIVSRATFFRLFKKYEGITPQEYRQLSGGAITRVGAEIETEGEY